MRVAIIGAGLAGVTAAAALRGAGLAPVVFDKSRGPGGRLSTRRAGEGLQFDHGAQYISPETREFAAFLRDMQADGAARTWDIGDGSPKFVGIPGMSALVRHLADRVDLRLGIEIPEVERDVGGWIVAGEAYDRVICAIPAPQAARLLAGIPAVTEALHAVVMEPNLTLMLAHSSRADHPFVTRRRVDEDIAWLSRDSAKPDRPGHDCWVAQAGLHWSRQHLEMEKEQIAAAMLPMVCDLLNLDPDDVIHAAAHRWRYAHASKPLGRPYLEHSDTLYVGGDWALSARAEGAWQSGVAMAEALLASR